MMKSSNKITGNKSCIELVSIDQRNMGQRLDNFLLSKLKKLPRPLIYRIIRKGEVRVNKKRARVDLRLAEGDLVRIPPLKIPPEKKAAKPGKNLSLLLHSAIIHESDALLVLNKPSGLAVHGGSGIHLGVIESLRHIRPDARFLELVHRIDRDTSGCLLIAKKRSMLRYLHEEIRQGRMKKIYRALVHGHWPAEKRVINAPLLKNILQSGERMVRVSEQGKASRTWFKVLKTLPEHTLLQVTLDTGRTHQIRVHTSYTGHPILGDSKYGDSSQDKSCCSPPRLMLHAAHLGLTLPDGSKLDINAPLPEEFDSFLNRDRRKILSSP